MNIPDPNPPRVGEPSDDYRSRCAFSMTPVHPQCELEAVTHLRVWTTERGEVALAACPVHSMVGRQAGLLIDEHRFSGYCGLPGSLWYPTHCDLDVLGEER
jgi:hypothetical protein